MLQLRTGGKCNFHASRTTEEAPNWQLSDCLSFHPKIHPKKSRIAEFTACRPFEKAQMAGVSNLQVPSIRKGGCHLGAEVRGHHDVIGEIRSPTRVW